MEAKDYLNGTIQLNKEIQSIRLHISCMRDMLGRATAAANSEPVSHSRNVHASEDLIVRIMEQEQCLKAAQEQLDGLRREIFGKIQRIPDVDCALVLEMRYLQFCGWEAIASNLHVHIRTAHKIHDRALQKYGAVLRGEKVPDQLKLGT